MLVSNSLTIARQMTYMCLLELTRSSPCVGCILREVFAGVRLMGHKTSLWEASHSTAHARPTDASTRRDRSA